MKKTLLAIIACVILWQVPAKAYTYPWGTAGYCSAFSDPAFSTSWTDPYWGSGSLAWGCSSPIYLSGRGQALTGYPGGNGVVNMTLHTGGEGYASEYVGVDNPASPTYYYRVDARWDGYLVITSYPGGTGTCNAWVAITVSDGMAVRTVLNGNTIGVFVNGTLAYNCVDTSGATYGTGSGLNEQEVYSPYGIETFQIGQANIWPNAITLGSIGVTPFSTHIDMSWPAATDGTGGFGIWEYQILRDGVLIGTTSGLTFSDTTVAPGVVYTYQLESRQLFI